MEDKKFYTLLVYSENIAGILNQITAVFTRRQSERVGFQHTWNTQIHNHGME